MEKVSIIVPVYNVKDYLERCVDSLIKQTYKNIEIILVDDCSTDGSSELAKKLAESDSRCIFIQREKNGGLSAARNTGMDKASGEWISFIDSDDWVSDDYVAAMYDVAKKDNADIVMSSIYYYFEDGHFYEVSPFSGLITESSQKEKIALLRQIACGKLYRYSLIKEINIKFSEDIWRCEDISTVIPWMTYTDKISILNKPTYYYFQRLSSISNTNHKNVDVSFYPKTINRMFELSNKGFETELEYRAICELMYGMVMIMVRSGRTNNEISDQIDLFNRRFLNWKKNSYLNRLAKGKRIFIFCASNKWIGVLKLLIWLWDKKQKF